MGQRRNFRGRPAATRRLSRDERPGSIDHRPSSHRLRAIKKSAASAPPRRAPCAASAQASRALIRTAVKMGRRHTRRRRGRCDDEISSFRF
ncbi:hypothetical protein F511_46076 [Dorcoceras hygrometricum]|uniref:Uncharacterized protein n=1 Tax=Dorcoceras hygrometricum TaxID=472368 RepID=A0A2Z7A1X4_9LAMI|nr:hypothetical protein F511_46076 [Dorcoceras hygrometricum]